MKLKTLTRLFVFSKTIFQPHLLNFWEVIETYRSYYSHFYSVKIDFTTQKFLHINREKIHVHNYFIEAVVVFFSGCLSSAHIAVQEFFHRGSRNAASHWYFGQMSLINLVIIILVGFSGFTQIILFYVTEHCAEEMMVGFNSLILFTQYLDKSIKYSKYQTI